MSFVNVKRSLASSLLLASAASCGSVEGIEPPINATSAGTVEEGGTLPLSGGLVTADPDSGADKLLYKVESLPANGALMHDGAALAVGETFSQKDVNDGKVSYVNDGEENTADAFLWSLSDGSNNLGPIEFAITITPVNDAPMIVNNTSPMLSEGGNAVVSAEQLTVADVETAAPTSLTFTVVSVTHGVLQQRIGSGQYDGIAAGATFTQQDLIDENIKFVDSGVDDANLSVGQPTTAGFSWSVADPDGGTTAGTTSFTVMPVDDPAVITWKASTCYTPNVARDANPVMALSDPDDPTSAYQICIASLVNGTQEVCPTGSTTQCVTNSVTPTVKNGATVLTTNSCVPANALTALTLTNTTSYGGGVYWQLKKGSVNVAGGYAGITTVTCP